MNHALTLGVIGHVDHGKTALVRALTGIETDRLKEERERGLSIVLGFAYLETDAGVIDLIDVPGHEDFIRAMIGGATALDGIVLCVAANEGVKPQTGEHFNIARLLGVERGFVAITKTDLVDAESLAAARAEIEDFVRDTFLEGAPVIEISATTGSGLDAVRALLTEMAARPVACSLTGRVFMPLDRVFTMRGFGLVVTGSLRGGSLHAGEAVEIVPGGRSATVRGLQNHNQSVDSVAPGQRVAVNLRNVGRDEVSRGDVLASPGAVAATRRLDTELRLLEDAVSTLRNGATVRLLTGTTEATVRVRLLDRAALAPGQSCLAQLTLDREIATQVAEYFLIRSHSPVRTTGGGRVLGLNALRHRRFDASVTERLTTIAAGDLDRIVRQRLDSAVGHGLSLAALASELDRPLREIEQTAEAVAAVRVTGDIRVAPASFDALLSRIVSKITDFHEQHADRNGLETGRLGRELANETGPAVIRQALAVLDRQGVITIRNGLWCIAGHDPYSCLSGEEQSLAREIEETYRLGGLEASTLQEVAGSDSSRKSICKLLLEMGRLVRLRTYDRSSQRVLHVDVLNDVRQMLEREYPHPATFALKDIRDLLDSSRKYVVPLMEHLDSSGVTVRTGDLRRLRENPELMGSREEANEVW